MVKLAIRDDDPNYFTKVEDLEFVYKDFLGFPVSYAVVPYVTDVLGGCPETNGNTIPMYIGDNENLSKWLRDKVTKGKIDILIHGIMHSYHFKKEIKIPEMIWRDSDPFIEQSIVSVHETLCNLFGYNITCFVAPSNKISKKCLQAVEECGLHFSGIIPLRFNERVTLKNVYNYIKRWSYRALYRLPFPGILHYSGHKEINACALQSYDYLVRMYKFCDSRNYPMVINVHYWSLRDKPDQLEILRKFVMDYAIPHGAVPTKLSDLLIE